MVDMIFERLEVVSIFVFFTGPSDCGKTNYPWINSSSKAIDSVVFLLFKHNVRYSDCVVCYINTLDKEREQFFLK